MDISMTIPEITDRFSYRGTDNNRCTGYFRKFTREEALSGMDRDNIGDSIIAEVLNKMFDDMEAVGDMKIIFCPREEAEYVSGAGVCGTIVPISQISNIHPNESFVDTKEQMVKDYTRSLETHLKSRTTRISKK
jgi:hypothetical protein